MRYPIFLILTCVLFFNSLHAQKNGISKEKWDAIVDQTNIEVTGIYIEGLFNSNKLNEKESKSYLDTLRPRFKSSSFKTPVPYDSLGFLMNSNFKTTFEKLSSKIESAKNKPKILDTLYNTLQDALRVVKKEDIYTSSQIEDLKTDITEFVGIKPNESETMFHSLEEEKIVDSGNPSIFSIPNVIIGILVLLLILATMLIFIAKKELKKLDVKSVRYKKERNNERSNNFENQPIIAKLRKENKELKEKLNQAETNKALRGEFRDGPETSSESSRVVDFGNPTPSPAPTNFYGGKPTPDRKFLETTENIREQETVYKFIFDGSNRNKATFEVILASEFMKKQIPNSPDDFLYRVCNNVNSNQDFRREIITERKGTAHLKDGIWVVDENDKALIKFQ